jgi:hypothetical protein
MTQPSEITPKMIVFAAAAVNESIRATQIVSNATPDDAWHKVSKKNRMLTIAFVEDILKNYRLSAREIHEEIRNDMVAEGWIFDRDFSERRKTTPVLLPWDQMSDLEQDLFFVSHSVVHAVFHRFISPALTSGKPFRMCGEEVK